MPSPTVSLIRSTVQITAWVDEGLDSKQYITPGLGDFGDR